MKQKHLKKRVLSLLLVFSMVVSTFTGQTFGTEEAKAASSNNIQLGELQQSENGDYYTYPNATVQYNGSNYFSYLTVTVDSGYMKVTSETDNMEGKGIVAGTDMDATFDDLNSSEEYEAIYFDCSKSDPLSKEQIEKIIRSIRFTTAPETGQEVSVCATTYTDDKLQVEIDDPNDENATVTVPLSYFNGHYYGYVPFQTDNKSWTEAYRESKTIKFCDAQGYLATLTTRAEDRFIFNKFRLSVDSLYANQGWIGSTRAKLARGSSYSDDNTRWQALDSFDFSTCQEDFIWRWVSGPEAGTDFGYQNHAFGDGTNGDGGFVTKDGNFSNWQNGGNIEPNGGSNTDEAYCYFGKYAYGRWNDAKNSGGAEYGIYGYYIEFGGYDGDVEKFEEKLGQITITTTQNSGDDPITVDTPAPREKIGGTLGITNRNTDANGNPVNEVGTILAADITGVTPEGSHNTLTYQWYYLDNNNTPQPIDGATDSTITLTEETLNKKLSVKVTGNGNYEGEVSSAPDDSNSDSYYDTTVTEKESEKLPIAGKPIIKNESRDDYGNPVIKEGTILTADIQNITPIGSHDSLTYEWYYGYVKDGSIEEYTKIENATEKSLVLTADLLEKAKSIETDVTTYDEDGNEVIQKQNVDTLYIIVKALASKTGDYIGESEESDSYNAARTNTGIIVGDDFTDNPNISDDIKDIITDIIDEGGLDNDDTDDDNQRYIVLSPTEENTKYAIKDESGNLLTDLPAYIIHTDGSTDKVSVGEDKYYHPDKGETIVVTVDKDKTYIVSEIKTTTTNTEVISPDISIPDENITGDNKLTVTATDDTISIVVDPADPDYKYAVLKKENGKYVEIYVTKDSNGNYQYTSDSSSENALLWSGGGEDKVAFTELPADGIYKIVAVSNKEDVAEEIKLMSPSEVLSTGGGSEPIDAKDYVDPYIVASPSIPDSSIKTEYKDNGTADNTADDTITITVDPADKNYKYAVLQKDGNGNYTEVTVNKDTNGNYTYDANGTAIWSEGQEDKVTFAGLPASGTYKIVALPSDTTEEDAKQLTPNDILSNNGGSSDIHLTPTPAGTATTTPSAITFTPEEIDKAEQFIKNYVTDPDGKIITEITDITRDIVASGETEWNSLTDTEKAAVNEKLKESGCPYTYEELLSMATSYKIPGFQVNKHMKKNSKTQLKMMKCTGATVVCTTTNKKVATVTKKGVLKAKKVGKATVTITATKGKYTNRLVIKVTVKKKFKNASELKKYKSSRIKTPTILIAKKRKVKKKTKLQVKNLESNAKVTYTAFNKKVLKITKKGKYTGKKKGKSLVRVKIKQNQRTYLLYVYVTIFK